MVSEIQKANAERFLKYHYDAELLVLLNSWDIASSKIIEACGYKAVATTSMGIAASLGYPDCQVITLSKMLESIKRIADHVNVPVTVDIEAGYGRNLNEVVDSLRQIIATGIVGINLEDSLDMSPDLVDENEFCERLSAIRTLSNSLGFHLVINARTDAFYTQKGSPKENLAESIRRGNKYKDSGADCIFVQPLWDKEMIKTLVKEIDAPINILANPRMSEETPPSVRELQDLGVARVSLGSGLMKSTLALIKKVADELSGQGTYKTLLSTMSPMTETAEAYAMATRMGN
ncbi:MAG: isocitrate lyase/phosphoenolpyruvate mutase family protein [Calditrichaeota bacterium]|nr:isocitrate lyase/phosphoenolpyruvate mutase family protein [Calditrichota bacterium]MCB9369211.1 isocitrate lyase/phosphoenolpyruvate mutase family protein [Calditrichota bacterium]